MNVSIRYYIVLFFCCAQVLRSSAQSSAQITTTTDTLRVKQLFTIAATASRIETDKLGNIYAYIGKEWVKYNSEGVECCRFSEHSLTATDVFDVSNPQKVLLYMPSVTFGEVLDRALTEEQHFNLTNSRFEISSACTASDGNIWVNSIFYKNIFKINRNGDEIPLAVEWTPYYTNDGLIANFMVQENDRVYLNVPNAGIFIFDDFGKFLKTIDLKLKEPFQVFGNKIVYYNNEKIHIFDVSLPIETAYYLPISAAISVKVQNNALVAMQKDKIVVYKVLKPLK